MSVFADYLTVSDAAEAEFTVKGSRFIGIVLPCAKEGDIKPNLAAVEGKYPGATHYCYGAVYGGTARSEKSSDNGEPSGTAARPILSVIRGNSLTDTMVVVVRYFGGTLLGTGGLVHAYTQGAADAVKCASIVKMTACSTFGITMPYDALNGFNAKCRAMCIGQPGYDYSDRVCVKAAVPVADADRFLQAVADATSRQAAVVPTGQSYVPAKP